MRTIFFDEIKNKVKDLCLQANCSLPSDIRKDLIEKQKLEESLIGKNILSELILNSTIAQTESIPLCQDTGVCVFFVEQGVDVKIEGGTLYEALNEGVAEGYKDHFLRKSIVRDPLFDRVNTNDNTPAIVHLELVSGDKLKITLAPKGAGSENMSALRMLKPYEGKAGVLNFILETVLKSGGNSCPPLIVGVGIGGNLEHSCYLAKKALLKNVAEKNPDKNYADFEDEIMDHLNASGIGPSGLGGTTTALAVHILTHPCHMASLPVAVNLNCNSARHASVII